MSKSKRLLDLMMTVNRKRKFTVRELADEFQVSSRTILRDLQELGSWAYRSIPKWGRMEGIRF